MAPSRKSRSVNRRIPFGNDVPLEKAEEEATKNLKRKRKLFDMLGPEWSNEELECFYEAYRKYGKDWKKVATAVHYRTADMIEALFNINRAYLSLPEGAASSVGLVAMMTDHYAMMERSDSEQGSSDRAAARRKAQKRTRARLPQNNSKDINRNLPDLPKSNLDISDHGCLSLLKKRRSGSKTRVVGRRTPRIPVSYSYDRAFGEKFISPNKQGFMQNTNTGDDLDVARGIVVALTKASQRSGSPHLSQTPKRKPVQAEVSCVRNGNGMHGGSESTSTKPHESELEGGCELSLGSSEGTGFGVLKKRKKHTINILEVKERAHFDDINEACSGTEEGEEVHVFKKKLESRVSSFRTARSPHKSLRKRGKKVLLGEERDSTFDALKTLADLSLMMPDSDAKANLSMQVKEEKEKVDTFKQSKLKGNLSVPTEVNPPGTSEAEKAGDYEINSDDELKEKVHHFNSGTQKRKQSPSPFRLQIPKADASLGSSTTKLNKIKLERLFLKILGANPPPTDFMKASKKKAQFSPQNTSQHKQLRMKKPPECTLSRTVHKMEINGLQSTSSINFTNGKSTSNHGVQKNRGSDNKFLESIKEDEPIPWLHDVTPNTKEKLCHFLSRHLARRWCIFEWFYSAIDYPWFARREFAEYLDHVGLGHVPCLTRVEWGVIRSSLGKPRRFSKRFLEEEREKLLQHRESVRMHHSSLCSGTLEVLPSDLPQPFSVGQRILVIHPKSREIHGGYVLTVDHSNCLVQFEQLELGIHWVEDIDCMPLNVLDNIPEALARSIQTSRKLNENNGFYLTGQLKDPKVFQFLELPMAKKDKIDIPSDSLPSAIHNTNKIYLPEVGSSDCNSQSIVWVSCSGNATLPWARNSQAFDSEQIQAREADIQALSELTRALGKKEAVLSQLRRMNDEVSKIQKDVVNALEDSEPFKKHYAATLLQLNDLNQQVSSALCCLRRRNSYQENVHPKCATTVVHPTIQLSSIDAPKCKPADSGLCVSQIIESSRVKARAMVVATMQAAASLFKEAKNPDGLEEALDFVNNQLSARDFLLPTDSVVNLESLDQVDASCSHNPSGLDLASTDSFAENTENIPSELITNCVAALLMIQNCTKRQCPPAEVAEIIDSAIKSLRPLCSQNLSIYTEIQNCMGMIRNQILGLVPTA